MPPSAAASNLLYSPYAVDTVLTVLNRLPDPDLVLEKLGMGRVDLRKLETDDEITGALDTRRDAVLGTPWKLVPYEESKHLWLWDALDPHIEALLTGAWQAVPYGYSVMEVVLKKGTPITIDSLMEKPLEWFEPRRDGSLWMTLPQNGVPQQVPNDGKFLMTVRSPTYRNPYGEALLSRCYWPWFFRYNGWQFWMQFLERFADPLLLGSVNDPAAFVDKMVGLGFKSMIGVGVDETVTGVTQAEGKSGFEAADNALIARIQKIILGQTLTTQMSSSGGSFAAAKVHNEVRHDKRDSDLRLIRKTGQTLVNLLWRVNNASGPAPSFTLRDDQGLEETRATRDATLVNAGILKLTDQYLLGRYDFEEGDFEIPASPPSVKLTPPSAGAATLSLAANGQRFSPDQMLVEELGALAVAQAQSPLPPALILSAIKASDSPEDLGERLATLYRDHDPVAFRELLERSLFAADVFGYVTAAKRIGAPA